MPVKDGSIELFRWICILAVMVQHALFPSRQSQSTLELVLTLKSLLLWCVPGFLFVSGWLTTPERDSVPRLVANKARRLLVPFLCVNLLVAILMVGLIRSGIYLPKDHASWTLEYIARQFLFLQGMGPQYYFLPLLFLVSVIAVGVTKLAGRSGGFAVFLGLAVFSGWSWGLPSTPLGSELDRYPLYLSIFAAGMALRPPYRNKSSMILAGVALGAGIWLAASGQGTSVLHCFLPIPLFLVIRTALGRFRMHWLGRWNSGAVYLWHAPFVMTAASIVCFRFFPSQIPALAATLVLTVVACQAIHLAIERARLGPYLSL